MRNGTQILELKMLGKNLAALPGREDADPCAWGSRRELHGVDDEWHAR